MRQTYLRLALLTLSSCALIACGTRADSALGQPRPAAPIATLTRSNEDASMDSSGNQSAAEPNPAGQAASQPAGPGTAEPEHTPLPNVATWQLYTDPVVPFSIRYPRSNVRLAEPATFDQEAPGLVQRVRFQDAQVARRDTAQLEPPQCTIEVFANPQSLGLEQWLDQSLPQGASREGAVVGNRQGYRVALHIMLAPNTFYYVADGAYIIRLTPLGTDAMQMVDSFTVGA